ncbi:RNA-dependent RNA polymerase 1-like [Punica granatum]|uniref:RNA-dependent RNA polymerase n=3 Tax=Punica granatum TaxID=22663 RepID=A0A6P8C5K0_PUNGR|nr:RNA-dependent RNA polymerase 1-like [Punica granatum]
MEKTIRLHGFPSSTSAERVKEFLENIIGKGRVCAIKVRQEKSSSRLYAIVQFMTVEDADRIVRLASRRLWYRKSYLTASEADRDIVPERRMPSHSIQGVTLHFGYQLSEQNFSTLWKEQNVSVDFGVGLRRFYFVLLYNQEEYKLDLSHGNIWQIKLHQQRWRRRTIYLLIQLLGAPRIFRKAANPSRNVLESLFYSYFRNGSDDQWVRTTDFTPSACIGQSSAMCLEIYHASDLPDFQENFAAYKEIKGIFAMKSGSSFSRDFNLVPIVEPPVDVDIPYKILFKINLLVQKGCLPGPCLDSAFYRLVNPHRIDITFIEYALEKLCYLKECCYHPKRWLEEQYVMCMMNMNLIRQHHMRSPLISLDEGLMYVHRVQITPCKVYFSGPEVNVSNRVLRRYSEYADNFLRISFVDEDHDRIHSTVLSRGSVAGSGMRTEIFRRILSTLQNGITIGDKKFDFLAFSSSQLRENSAWMFAPVDGCTADTIRESLGEFHQIRNVAKYAARLGQSLSSSTETLSVEWYETEEIPDIEVICGNKRYIFSDGIGKISDDFAKKVAKKCGFKGYNPSAFQIQYGGYKGVVAIDPTSPVKLSLRRSMRKYESSDTKLNVLAWSKYQPCFLNRQIITLLSTLGVPDGVFEQKQREAVDQLDSILTDPLKAQEALDLMAPGENTEVLKQMLVCGYEPDKEPFLSMMLRTFRASKLFVLRKKTGIFIPEGRSMMGCLDETQTLEYGQVFVQFSRRKLGQLQDNTYMHTGTASDESFVVQGQVVVAKNPCLHPGDVRVLRAVNVPALHHMVDCVVFPQKGMRPHPNECSGSDLDGDFYFVSWDSKLIPPVQDQPMDYTAAPTVELDHDVRIEEVEEYFVNYLLNDSLGIIANAHTVFADRSSAKARCPKCIKLAKLFSVAVDFPKTGVPAEIPPNLYAKKYPDFMKKLDKSTYKSKNVIGKLFREVRDMTPDSPSLRTFTKEEASWSYDPDMEVEGFKDYVDDAFYYKGNYDFKLGNFMDYYGIRTEAEILSGNIMKLSKSFSKRKDSESISMAVKALRKEAMTWFNEKATGSDGSEHENLDAKASAWYYVTYHPSYWGAYNEGLKRDHYLSFPWCVYGRLIKIKKEKIKSRRSRSREDIFTRELSLS